MQQMSPSKRWVVPVLWVGVLAISFAAIFFRKAEISVPGPTHPLAAASIRLLIAGALLFPFVVRARRQGRLPNGQVALALGGGVLYAIHFGSWVTSLTLTTVAASVTLVTATPLLLALASLVTGRDRPNTRHWIAILLAVIGVTIIGGVDAFRADALLGDALAFVGAIAMAGYLLIVRSVGDKLDPWAFTGIAAIVGGVLLAGSGWSVGIPLKVASFQALGFLLLAALVPQLIGHTALTWVLRHVRPTTVGIATVGEPVGAALLAWFWLDESIPFWSGLGCVVTIFAVVVGVAARGRGEAPSAVETS